MLTLTYRGETTIPVEAECITPDNLAGKKPAEVAALAVQYGNAPAPLGDFFHVEGHADDGEVVLEGSCGHVKWIGAGMSQGRITVVGTAGMHLGSEMRGGVIEVKGNAADWVGAEMRGGRISIEGDAGHLAGAGYRGSRRGMRGGVILIHGRAGNELGSVMRRGLIAVGGACGEFAGVSLLAGSILLFGPCGSRPGAGMKRGTIAFFNTAPALLPTFRCACTYAPVFLSLYLRRLKAWGFPVEDRHLGGTWRRYCGDLVSRGKGEILVRQETGAS